jgi:hypothetical protein
MKQKRAPDQYAAKPKPVVVKPTTTPIEHPALGVAKQLVSWLDRGGTPPSIILLHGLHFARSRDNDGHPVDTYRPHLIMQGTDSKTISEIMDALALPQANKIRLIAAWLQSNWVKKSAPSSQVSLPQKLRQQPTHNKPVKPKRKATGQFVPKPVVVVKKK